MNTSHDSSSPLGEEPAKYNASPAQSETYIHFRPDEAIKNLRRQLFTYYDPITTNVSAVDRIVYQTGLKITLAEMANKERAREKRTPKKRP